MREVERKISCGIRHFTAGPLDLDLFSKVWRHWAAIASISSFASLTVINYLSVRKAMFCKKEERKTIEGKF